MAISMHVAQYKNKTVNGKLTRVIADDEDLATTDGNPTVKEFLLAEAAAGYLPIWSPEGFLCTVSVADMNSAGS